jgi:hypothetical protein
VSNGIHKYLFSASRGEEGVLEYTEIKTVTMKISQKNS